MPEYEYECKGCGERFSVLFLSIQSAEREKVICPKCTSADVQRLISRVAVVGDSGPDPAEAAHERKQAEKKAGMTPLSKINEWRGAKKKKD